MKRMIIPALVAMFALPVAANAQDRGSQYHPDGVPMKASNQKVKKLKSTTKQVRWKYEEGKAPPIPVPVAQ